jgi:hypothetical protein
MPDMVVTHAPASTTTGFPTRADLIAGAAQRRRGKALRCREGRPGSMSRIPSRAGSGTGPAG